MREPSERTSRFAIAGGVAAVIVVGGIGFALGRSTAEPAPDPAPMTIAPSPTPTIEPVVVSSLDRGDIIELAALAADAFSANESLPESVAEAVNRRFEIALPFGCSGPSAEGSRLPFQWRYDEAAETLRIAVEPTVWTPEAWNVHEDDGVEDIEGFWITRPWSSGESCPPVPGQAVATGMEPVTLPGQTLAIAQFGAEGASRITRGFDLVRRVPAEDFDAARGYRIRLTGRIAPIAGGDPVRCVQPAGIEQRPICVVSVELREVQLENPADDEVLATWDVGDRSDPGAAIGAARERPTQPAD